MDTKKAEEFFLRSLIGDEEFEVLGADDQVLTAGEMVSFNRGDRVRVLFNALSAEWGEPYPQYIYEVIVFVNDAGKRHISER